MRFMVTLTERNGEHEYAWPFLITADNQREAYRKACEHAADWYGDDGVREEDGGWYFNGGAIIVTVSYPFKMSLRQYIKHILALYTIE